MRVQTTEDLLARAAREFGIEPAYTDTWGQVHPTSAETARAILEALGVDVSTSETLDRALAKRETEHWQTPLDPTIVVREEREAIDLRIPESRKGASLKLEIEWENGEIEHHWYWAPELRNLNSHQVNGVTYISKRIPLPKPLRLGYHHLRMHWMKAPELETFAQAHFIVCPSQARRPARRMAGLAVSLYGLRSLRNWGCGDFTDLRSVIRAFARAGAEFMALNPLHAIANRQPYNISPYLPECALFRNFIYLDVERVAESLGLPLETGEAVRAEIASLRASEFVEYERVARIKQEALADIFGRFVDGGGSRHFDQYSETCGSTLDDYAVYCALWEHIHAQNQNIWLWTDWPEQFRDPRSPVCREFAKQHQRRVLFFKFLQWQLSCQAAGAHEEALQLGMEIGLYHDLALATDRFGADLWARREFYADGARSGAPPDALAPAGQDWGFPPPNRDRHRADGYRLFAQSIRKAAEAGGALRIDHVMRFFRLFWIPEKLTAREGAYVTDYAEDLLGILALESQRGNFVIVGEDLGTVTGEVRHALYHNGVLSYRLLWFERDGGRFRAPSEYPEHALVSTTTHDLPTLAGFFASRDIEARRAANLADEEAYRQQSGDRIEERRELNAALSSAGFPADPIGFVLATPSLLAVVNQEDLTGETEQQNLPGSTWQFPNWRRKMLVAVEDLGPLAEIFRSKVERSGRW